MDREMNEQELAACHRLFERSPDGESNFNDFKARWRLDRLNGCFMGRGAGCLSASKATATLTHRPLEPAGRLTERCMTALSASCSLFCSWRCCSSPAHLLRGGHLIRGKS
jgi:hypothetical protein